MDNVDFTRTLCEKIKPLVEPLSHHINLNVFGYRKFFPDGTCFNASSNFEWAKFVQEKLSNKIVPNYEKEVLLTLKEGKRYFLRIGEPDRQDSFLSMLYEKNIWNTLSLYQKNEDSLEAFYITTTRENYKIVSEYFNNLDLFVNFSHYFKNKINDIISLQEMKKASSLTISPQIFEEHNIKTN
jgi:hypothetical protein